MEGRRVLQASNLKIQNERRKPRSHQRWNWESGKIRRKLINWSHKIPFCLDVRSNWDKSWDSFVNVNTSNISENIPLRLKGHELKFPKGGINLKLNKERVFKYIENSKFGNRFK